MLYLSDIDLFALRDSYNLSNYVETGLGKGSRLEAAAEVPFDQFYSCDVSESLVAEARPRFPKSTISIYHGDSITFLREVVATLENPTFFWLDACFPYSDMPKTCPVYFPLPYEIATITDKRDFEKDVVVCGNLAYVKDVNNPLYQKEYWDSLDVHKQLDNLTFKKIIEPLTYTHTWEIHDSTLLFLPRR